MAKAETRTLALGSGRWRGLLAIGIGAPLDWPTKPLQAVQNGSQQAIMHLAKRSGEVGSRLAYRLAFACGRWGRKSLDAGPDRRGSNAAKAITPCRLLGRNSRTALAPFSPARLHRSDALRC